MGKSGSPLQISLDRLSKQEALKKRVCDQIARINGGFIAPRSLTLEVGKVKELKRHTVKRHYSKDIYANPMLENCAAVPPIHW